jgi:hypothetical protein
MLTTEDNLASLEELNRQWVRKAVGRPAEKRIILDMGNSESPVYGEQEGSAYNGHFDIRCYHPLFWFNQHGDCEGAMLRRGNVHSASIFVAMRLSQSLKSTNILKTIRSSTPSGCPLIKSYRNKSNIC